MQEFESFLFWLGTFILKTGIGMCLISIAFVVMVNAVRDATVYVQLSQDKLWRERQHTARVDAEAINQRAAETFQVGLQRFRTDFAEDMNKRSEELRKIVNATQKGGPVQ